MAMNKFLSDQLIQELKREKRKMQIWIETCNPFANPHELTQQEVYEIKQTHNAILNLLHTGGAISETEYTSNLYVC